MNIPWTLLFRPCMDAFLLESFRHDRDPYVDGPDGITESVDTNRYSAAPKILAQANRADGFTVFAWESESGRSGNTLLNAFDTDICQFGFVGYPCEDGRLKTVDMGFAHPFNQSTARQ